MPWLLLLIVVLLGVLLIGALCSRRVSVSHTTVGPLEPVTPLASSADARPSRYDATRSMSPVSLPISKIESTPATSEALQAGERVYTTLHATRARQLSFERKCAKKRRALEQVRHSRPSIERAEEAMRV